MADFNAASAYEAIKKNYLDFLLDRTCGPFPNAGEEDRWEKCRNYLKNIWTGEDTNSSLFAKPVMEGLFPYPPCGQTIEQLIASGVFHESMRRVVSEELRNGTYQLYQHQLEAVNAIRANKNIIVSSGTGSGKTECFLFPILNQLLQEGENLTNNPGVRVLMIYPMNALVKDQLMRIVKMVTGLNPRITVGMFTSQTYDKTPQHRENFPEWERRGIESECYICSKAALRDAERPQPHILITNYSMLEYMMLRDKDKRLFEGGKLHSIVLDEAHLYSGSLGNDINMLIRRVLLRYNKTHDDIRFYATSATIGDGNPDTLRDAAANLFGVSRETIEPISGDRTKPENQLMWPGADEQSRAAAGELKQRLFNNPTNYMQVSQADIDLLSRMSLEAKDENDKPYLPHKLHVFINSPKYFYSDMNLNDKDGPGARPLGNLQAVPIFNDRTGIQVFSTNKKRQDFYFKAKITVLRNAPGYKLFSYESDRPGNTVYFRLRSPLDDPHCHSFDLDPDAQDVWNIVENENGKFVFALRQKDLQVDPMERVINGNISEWYSVDGQKLQEFSGDMEND